MPIGADVIANSARFNFCVDIRIIKNCSVESLNNHFIVSPNENGIVVCQVVYMEHMFLQLKQGNLLGPYLKLKHRNEPKKLFI